MPPYNRLKRQHLIVISYEFPITEQIRTLLRLEDLYNKTVYYVKQEEAFDHHVALLGLFEITEVASRGDLKSDLLKELQRQRHTLLALRDNPHISEAALDDILGDIDAAHQKTRCMVGTVGQSIRNNDWLMAIKQRTTLPGGACEFDLPSYHYWRKQSPTVRRRDLENWLSPLLPIKHSLDIILRLLRSTAKTRPCKAKNGYYQEKCDAKSVQVQLLRVMLEYDQSVVPELSANRYTINICFINPSFSGERTKLDADIPFSLCLCGLGYP